MRTSRHPLRSAALAVGLCALIPAADLARAEDTPPVTEATTTTSLPAAQSTTTSTVPNEYVPPARVRRNVRIGSAVVVLDEQNVYVYSVTRRLIAVIPASTGLDDTTPVGSFRVFSKSALAYFTPNPGERMRWMVRFTKGRQGDNVGFHGIPFRVTSNGEKPIFTPVGLMPVSHGCIRTRDVEAKWLFDNMSIGTPVRVVRSRRG